MKKFDKLLIAFFALFLCSGLLLSVFLPDRTFSDQENRVLAQAPAFSFDKLFSGEFTSDFAAYVADQFPGRDAWVSTKTLVRFALAFRDNNGVYLGDDGWLFEVLEAVDSERLDKNIQAVNQFFQKVQLPTLFLCVPSSVQILSQYLPPLAPLPEQDKVIDAIREGLDLPFFDATEVLSQHKDEDIYFHTDHHWTQLGAYYVYQAVAAQLGFDPEEFTMTDEDVEFFGTLYSKINYPFAEPDTILLFHPSDKYSFQVEYLDTGVTTDSLYSYDKLNEKDKYQVYLDGNHTLVKITSNNKNGKKLFIVKDSYAHAFVPFLAPHYEEIHMVDLRYFNTPAASEYVAENGITDVLFLYSANNFSTDANLPKLR